MGREAGRGEGEKKALDVDLVRSIQYTSGIFFSGSPVIVLSQSGPGAPYPFIQGDSR
jgi:hypothetical protein